MPRQFEFEARILVEQYYASGPDRMKQVIAAALEKAATSRLSSSEQSREQLLEDVKLAELASERGSE